VTGLLPARGKVPAEEDIAQLMRDIGYQQNICYALYDDEGGGWAGRMAWTLDLIGHDNWCYLNGGLHAWLEAGYPTDPTPIEPVPSAVSVSFSGHCRAVAEDILEQLGDPGLQLWDARSPEEFNGQKVIALRGGHIPGARNYEWTRAMDASRGMRIRKDILQDLALSGLTPDNPTIVYCQAHHRSAYAYMLGRILGFSDIKGYDGSWSEWGNREDTPVEL
jgi:thiosulfate/3-mercaptopyruvate sulfurtransferase